MFSRVHIHCNPKTEGENRQSNQKHSLEMQINATVLRSSADNYRSRSIGCGGRIKRVDLINEVTPR